MSHALVSVVIPCRNEVAHISPCLDSILATGYPKDRLEVLAIDGMSTDGTREILAEYARRHLIITVLNNPKQTIPAAMNIGILHARGDVIMKMDAHSMYSRHYVSRCVAMMDTYGADNVGGFIVARPSAPTAVARAIAAALSHPFGTLNSHFKLGTDAPRWVDTVAFGCYRKEVFARVGLYDENLKRSSDMDFNIRLRKAGGRILLIPEAINYYYLRSDLIGFWWHNYEDGYWATYPLKFGRRVFAWRHLAPAMLTVLFAIALVGAVWAYWLLWFSALLLSVYAGVSLLSSLQIARRGHDWRSLGVMPIIFAIRHLGYALGSLVGLVAALLSLVSRGRMPGRQLSGLVNSCSLAHLPVDDKVRCGQPSNITVLFRWGSLPLLACARGTPRVMRRMRASQSSVDQQVRKAADEPSKRIFDVCCAALGLVVLSPVFAVTAVLVKLDSRGPVFYRGLRMGRYGKLFRILKFRTMVANADKIGGPSTPDDDPRLTRAGRILRRYKLDEIPQLINVLKGEMSIVGPRPEVEEEVRTYTTEERLLLTVRPGMTDYASIRFHNEGQIIRGSPDPHQAYREKIRPEKIRLGLAYVRSHSMWVDLRIIWLTLKTLILTRLPPDSDEAVSA